MVLNCLLTTIRIWFNKAFLRNQVLFIPQCTCFGCYRVDFLHSSLYEAVFCVCTENNVDNINFNYG